MSQLYTSQPTVNRLLTTFSSLFPSATRRTRHLLAWLLIAQLALESAPSVRCLFRQFLSKQTDASLNSYYRALGNGLVTDASIRQALALQALAIVPEALRQEPILLSVDDTSIAKWGKHFDGVGILYDHAKHDGKSYFNGHAFVSLTMSVPVLHETAGKQQIRYIAVPIGYVMSNGEASKLTLACQLLDEVMPILEKRQVILLFDSWYAKRELLAHALSYPNLNVTCNARHDTAMFELPDSTAGRRGRPPKYGKRLMLDEIANASYGNVYIKDADGNRLYSYGCYPGWGATGNNRKDAVAKYGLQVGDLLTIIGAKGSHNGEPQISNGVYFSHTPAN